MSLTSPSSRCSLPLIVILYIAATKTINTNFTVIGQTLGFHFHHGPLILLFFITLKASGRSGSRGGGDDVDLRLLVHQSQAGCIIGKSGFKIKELREVSVIQYYY